MPSLTNSVNNFAAFENNLVSKAMDSVFLRGDRLMKIFILSHFLIALLLGAFFDTWLITVSVGFLATALFFVSVHFLPGTFFTRCISGLSLQIFVALHIYQLHGLAEMHFFFFTAFTMMIVYQDWKSMWPGALAIIAQHTAFALLHNQGVDLYFFEDELVSFAKLVFHFGIALLQVVVCGYWAYLLRQQTIAGATNHALLQEKNHTIAYANQELAQSLEEAQSIGEELRQQTDSLKSVQEELERKQLEIAQYNAELENKIALRTQDLQDSLQRSQEHEMQLKKVSENLQIKQQEMERQQFIESSLSRFDDIMRLNYNKPVEEFADVVAAKIAKITRCMRVCVFLYYPHEELLRAIGGYACTPRTVLKKEFMLGEGLLGQVAKSREILVLENLPANSTRVSSSLTEIENKHVVLIPLVYNEQVQGVIEITSMYAPGELNMEFLRRVSKNIAAMLLHITTAVHTQQLLEESQTVMLQVRAQEEETRQHLEELEATQEEMTRREKVHLCEIQILNQQHEISVAELTHKNRELSEVHEEVNQHVEEMKTLHDMLSAKVMYAEERTSLLQFALDFAPQAILTFNEKQEIEVCNQAALKLLGYREEELKGLAVAKIFSPAHLPSLPGQLAMTHTNEGVQLRRKDGTLVPAEIQIVQSMTGQHKMFTAFIDAVYLQQESATVLLSRSNQ